MKLDEGEGPRAVHVQITDIVLRPEWQVRAQINHRTVGNYMTATLHGNMPPVRIARVDGALMLVDGWHRLEAAKRLHRERISATVEDMTEEQAAWAAAEANTMHGLPLKPAEKRQVFRRYVKTKQHLEGRRFKSYRDMASDLNGIAGKSSLARWMEADFPKIAARMTSGHGAKTSNAVTQHTQHFQTAVEHLAQIIAVAPTLGEGERQELVHRLNEARSKVITAAPWTEPEEIEL